MKLIFLDVDGVLNTKETRSPNACVIDAERLVLVEKLVRSSGAQVILTSSWRLSADAPWREPLARGGVSVVDQTPRLNGNNRQREILSYLSGRDDVERFVILDDQVGRWGALKPYVVRIDPRKGLTPVHVTRAMAILNAE